MKKWLLFGLLMAAVSSSYAAENCPRTVVRIQVPNRAALLSLTSWTEPWEYEPKTKTVVTDLDEEGLSRINAMGLQYEVDAKRTEAYCAPHFRLPGQRSGIPGYPCYRTVEETFATAEDIVAAHPLLAHLVDAGDSWEKSQPGGNAGYDMRVLVLTNSESAGTPTGEGQGKPVFFVTSAIHAREYTTAELMTRFAEYLIDNYGVDADATWLLDEHEIHLMLQTNPDGRKQAETGRSWRKNTNENYCGATSNLRGADLNRNFSFQWGCCGGSSSYQCDETYRGPSAASEPEVQAVQNYARSIFPDQRGEGADSSAPDTATGIYLDIHSYSGLVLWPWGYGDSQAPNGLAMQTLGRKLAAFNDYEPEQAAELYPTDGTTDDFVYGDLGVASFTFELGTEFFQDCATFENTILPDNLKALIYAAKVARTPYMTPSGPELLDLGLSGGTFIEPGTPVTVSAEADDTRFKNSNGSEPTGIVAAARCSIDVPPWRSSSPSFTSLSASDGAFDSGVETVAGSLSTNGLSNGRHTLFCQAQDDDNIWGAVSALFLWVLDPADASHIVGSVRSSVDGTPIDAVVSVGITSAATNPVTGSYDLMVPDGVYTVTAGPVGPDFAPSSVETVSVATGETTTVNFLLRPFQTVFSDDGENGNAEGWTADSPWSLSAEDYSSPGTAWSDSPGGNYGTNRNVSLTSPILDLSEIADVQLRFAQHYQTESGWDYCYLEYSTDGGSTWSTKASFDGDSGGWVEAVYEMPEFDGQAEAMIRFRLTSDVAVEDNGWHVDDVVIRGLAVDTDSIFADGFETGIDAWDYVSQ